MELHPKRLRHIRLYVGFVALGAVLLYWELIALGEPFLPTRQNWAPVLLFSVLLFLGESQPRLWMRWGDQGMVTPGWAFAYALVLVGTPVGAILVMVCTNLYVDARHRKGAAQGRLQRLTGRASRSRSAASSSTRSASAAASPGSTACRGTTPSGSSWPASPRSS